MLQFSIFFFCLNMLQDCYLMTQVPNENMLSLYDGVPNIFQSSTLYCVLKTTALVGCFHLLSPCLSFQIHHTKPFSRLIQRFIISELISVIYVPLSLSTVSGSNVPRKFGVKETQLKENMIKGDIVFEI